MKKNCKLFHGGGGANHKTIHGRVMDIFCNNTMVKMFEYNLIIIITFNIYIAQINIQEDMIKCALQIKIEYKIMYR